MRASSMKFHFGLHLPVILRGVLLVLLVLALGVGIFFGVRGFSSPSQSLSEGGILLSGASVRSEYAAMEHALVGFDGTYLRGYDLQKGELLWERTPDGSKGYSFSASSALAAVYKGNTLSVYSDSGSLVFSQTTERTIAKVRAGKTAVAVLYDDESLEVIDKTGKSLEVLEAEYGLVTDFGMYSSSDLLWVLTLDASGIEPISRLNIYQPGKLLLSGFSSTEQLYDQPVMSGNTVCIVGTHTVDIRSTEDESTSQVQVYGWTLRDSYVDSDSLSLLFSLTEQGREAASLRVVTGGSPQDLRMHAGCSDILMGKDGVYGLSGQTLYFVPLSGGKTQSYSLPYSADGVLLHTQDGELLLSSQEQVYLVRLP